MTIGQENSWPEQIPDARWMNTNVPDNHNAHFLILMMLFMSIAG